MTSQLPRDLSKAPLGVLLAVAPYRRELRLTNDTAPTYHMRAKHGQQKRILHQLGYMDILLVLGGRDEVPMLATVERFAGAHGRRLRLAVLPVATVATVLTVVGRGVGWRFGSVGILALVTLWSYLLYSVADRRCEELQTQLATADTDEAIDSQLHAQVCGTTDYWDYLRDLLAEVANTSIPGVLAEPVKLPASSAELGDQFTGSEKMMRELLDHIVPPRSRYVVYYIFDDKMQPSSEVHNGWKGRPPDLQQDSLRHDLLLTMAKSGQWVVLPDVKNLAPSDIKFAPLCFDRTRFRSFASLPLMVEEPVDTKSDQQNSLPVGTLIVEASDESGVSENFCRTAMQVAADILALGFAGARSRFMMGSTDAKR